MNDFEFYTPTKVFFGRNKELLVGKIIREYGYKKVLVHYGGGSAIRSGLIGRIINSLDESGIEHVELGGVVPNPRLTLVEKGIEVCKREGVDMILAVGGGSVIDSSKAIALGLFNVKNDVWDFFDKKASPKGIYPVGVVLTIAAAGSEMSNSCVITNDRTGEKKGCRSDHNRPLFAVMNPELTETLPSYQTACGIVDIMMHTLERFFATGRGNDLSDKIALSLLLCVTQNGLKLLEKPRDFYARSEIMWASSISHNGLTGMGSSEVFVCHPMEHELSALFDVAHGAGLAVIFPAWARHVYQKDVSRFALYAREVWGVDEADDATAALAGIIATEEYFKKLNMPLDFTSLGIGVLTSDQIEFMVDRITANGSKQIMGYVPLYKDDIVEIYNSINH